MKKIIDLCLEYKLVTPEEGSWLLAAHERRHTHPIRIVIAHGIDEHALFTAASDHYHVPLYEPGPDAIVRDMTHVLSQDIQDSFDCLVADGDEEHLTVVSWNFAKTGIIPAALHNLTGKTISFSLVACSVFDTMTLGQKT